MIEIYFILFLIDSNKSQCPHPHQVDSELRKGEPPSCSPIYQQIRFFLPITNLSRCKTEVLIFTKDIISTLIAYLNKKGQKIN